MNNKHFSIIFDSNFNLKKLKHRKIDLKRKFKKSQSSSQKTKKFNWMNGYFCLK